MYETTAQPCSQGAPALCTGPHTSMHLFLLAESSTPASNTITHAAVQMPSKSVTCQQAILMQGDFKDLYETCMHTNANMSSLLKLWSNRC